GPGSVDCSASRTLPHRRHACGRDPDLHGRLRRRSGDGNRNRRLV
ncbi:MAG: hypothetical protein AVDCRST_MAG90-87, partial [uncultured Microvirga sp.]